MQLCGACRAEILEDALRCASCDAPFEGSNASPRLSVKTIENPEVDETGVTQVGVTFGVTPDDDQNGSA